MESASWLSVYGRKFRGRGETTARAIDDEEVVEDGGGGGKRRGRSRRVSTLSERNDDGDDDDDDDDYYYFDDDENSPRNMSPAEISAFESQYNIPYDPYYDEPYTESQLPLGKYKVDKSYGDRRYENGEIFYKDENTGYYYRMGSRPRQKKFWDWGNK